MATISSPRQTVRSPLPTPSSSSRPSLDVQPSASHSPSRSSSAIHTNVQVPARRNRALLRDYYGLQASSPTATISDSEKAEFRPPDEVQVPPSALDAPDFDAEAYTKDLLSKEGLQGLLREGGGLMSDVRSLDGERKALVYDNYSKLIAATDTIRRMRSNMDPLAPTTSTLAPAIAHIAETAEGLAQGKKEVESSLTVGSGDKDQDLVESKQSQQREKRRQELTTVRWVFSAPGRLVELIEKGERSKAEQDWDEVRRLLDRWGSVKGIDTVREDCLKALEKSEPASDSD